MSMNGFRIMDSDIHLCEPPDLWSKYIEPQYKDRVRGSKIAFERVLSYFQFDDKVMPAVFRNVPPHVTPDTMDEWMASIPVVDLVGRRAAAKYREYFELGWDGKAFLRAMDLEGVDSTVIFPTTGMLAIGMRPDEIEPEFAAAIARAYNNWLHEFCQADPKRLFGAAMISVHSVDYALVEARRAVEELGFKSLLMRPNLVHGRNWYDPAYEPLWSLAEEMGVPVTFHEGIGATLPHAGDCFRGNLFLHHVACHPLEMMLATMSFCGGGVLERHPNLRVAFLEGNVSWLPWLLDRLDEHYEIEYGVSRQILPHKPSEYFKRQCFTSLDSDERGNAEVIAKVGIDNFVFSTDFPHPDAKFPRAVSTFLATPDLTDAQKRQILWDNCRRLYGMPLEAETPSKASERQPADVDA
jgi:predicted TIM-barrel fold metal-dependent hydrolase